MNDSNSNGWNSKGFGYLKPAEHVFISKNKTQIPQERVTVNVSKTISDPNRQINAKPATGKEIDAKAAQIKAKFLEQKAQEKSHGR